MPVESRKIFLEEIFKADDSGGVVEKEAIKDRKRGRERGKEVKKKKRELKKKTGEHRESRTRLP